MQVIAGRFELHRQIGSGGMGAVWLARDRKAESWVAVKVLRQSESVGLLRFVREQSLRINHPHVVTPRGWAADDDQVALSMDLMRGGSVAMLLRDHGTLPEPFVAVIVDQLLRALAAVHSHGVVHRDVTPGNLLLEPTGSGRPFVRLSDFGIAVVLTDPRITQTGTSVGTAGYQAPEQGALADPDPRSDLYAVGVIGRQMLTGLPADRLAEGDHGPFWDLLMQLSDNDIRRRPASAAIARERLAPRVPAGAPWADGPDGPYVFDQFDLPVEPPPSQAGTRATRLPTTPPPAPDGVDGVVAGHSVERSRGPLLALTIGSFALAAVLLVVLILLLR